jgi:endonuclease/exonuclease/phosphatase family metal-dependent hydrolase
MEAQGMRLFRLLPFAMPLLVAFLGYSGCQDTAQVLEKIPVGNLANYQSPLDGALGELANEAIHNLGAQAGINYGQNNGQPNYGQNGYGQNGYQGQASYPNQQPNPNSSYANAGYGQGQNYPQQQSNIPVSAHTGNNARIRIGSFNIQAFGESKMSETNVMQAIAAVITNFDVIAIQEIRSKNQDLMNVLMNYVNQRGAQYAYMIGPRLGRTVSKEQYAYIYNTQTIAASQQQTYTVNDDQDLLHREPFVARFMVLGTAPYPPFTFTMADVHTDPDEAIEEVTVLGHVFQSLMAYEGSTAREDDVIMVGDFNASAQQIASVAPPQTLVPTITKVATNVAGNAQYDNILINPLYSTEFTGNCGVFDLGAYFNIGKSDVLKISDHLPVWAEFSAYESTNVTANTASIRRY